MSRRFSSNQPTIAIIIAARLLALVAGCATVGPHTHPQFEQRVQSGMRVALLPPDVKV